MIFPARLERFRAKWTPVRVKKTRQNKKLEPGSDSIRTGKALVSIAISALFSLCLPARAQEFNRQDLDCAVAAKIENAQARTARQNNSSELTVFFINRLVARDDQTNWARVVYDRSQLNRKGVSAELLAKCKELYLQSLHR